VYSDKRDRLSLLRFQVPLIEPDVRICRIRLSDEFSVTAHGQSPYANDRSRWMPSFPKTFSPGNCLVPREDTLRRFFKNRTTRSYV